VFAADTDAEASRLFTSLQQAFVNLRTGRPGKLPPAKEGYADALPPADRRILESALSASVVGSPNTVAQGLESFVARTGADELMITTQMHDHAARLRSYELIAAVIPEDQAESRTLRTTASP
jgi:alkanesulfonate monooxygenase SsuD/methylene tetrahydromethanopterin reductase-like flavin-dependent oxidoreductase (luciferase family)